VVGEALDPLRSEFVEVDAGLLRGSCGERCFLAGESGVGAEFCGEVRICSRRVDMAGFVGNPGDVGVASAGAGPTDSELVAVVLHLGLGEVSGGGGVGEERATVERSDLSVRTARLPWFFVDSLERRTIAARAFFVRGFSSGNSSTSLLAIAP